MSERKTADKVDVAGAIENKHRKDSQMTGRKMPKYRSHKEVCALKIAAISICQDRSAVITPEDDRYAQFQTKPGFYERFQGKDGDDGYYVRYQDGYESWSPTKAFEEGYTLITDAEKSDSSLKTELRDRIEEAINCVCAENGSNTPDFILAEYLTDCLAAFDKAVVHREKWYGRDPEMARWAN